MAWIFLNRQEVLEIHTELIDRFGGTHGLRDKNGLESALAAAENRYFYENAPLPICAATYAFHLTQAHAFIDGNKRIAAFVSELFLNINGARFATEDEKVIHMFLSIAAGELSRQEVENFFVAHTVFLPDK
jgi:death-on-curing protein